MCALRTIVIDEGEEGCTILESNDLRIVCTQSCYFLTPLKIYGAQLIKFLADLLLLCFDAININIRVRMTDDTFSLAEDFLELIIVNLRG